MLIHVLAVRDTDWTVQIQMALLHGAATSCRGLCSQVFVGVVLALAVDYSVQEGQVLIAALKLQDPTVQIQAALREDSHREM